MNQRPMFHRSPGGLAGPQTPGSPMFPSTRRDATVGATLTETVEDIMPALSVAGAALGAYHGYKRNGGSIGWALGWSIFGGALPIFAIPLALAQGVGKRPGR